MLTGYYFSLILCTGLLRCQYLWVTLKVQAVIILSNLLFQSNLNPG